jgi:tripartite-type tricarboxylate transporter receptor subunit TctC
MFQFQALAQRALPLAIVTILTATSPGAFAQGAWPNKPVTIVVPFSAGGSTDVVARLLAKELGKTWGQTVMVENRAGAGGNIGTALVAKSKADGYSLLLASGSIFTVNPHLYAQLPFHPQKDFVPITNVASGPMVVVVPATASKITSLADLIAKAKAKPGSMNFGSAGAGSQVHMAAEKFADAAKIAIQHVPYKGEAPAYTDLMAGQTDLMVGNIGAAATLVNDGRLRAVAVTGKERSKLLPEVPTVAESGLPEAENMGWFGLFAPAGTPKDIIDKVQRDTSKALAEPEIKNRLAGLGMAPVANQPAELAKAIEQESEGWALVVKNRKLSAN